MTPITSHPPTVLVAPGLVGAGLGTSGVLTARPLDAAPRRDGIVDLDQLLDALGPSDLLESADRSG